MRYFEKKNNTAAEITSAETEDNNSTERKTQDIKTEKVQKNEQVKKDIRQLYTAVGYKESENKTETGCYIIARFGVGSVKPYGSGAEKFAVGLNEYISRNPGLLDSFIIVFRGYADDKRPADYKAFANEMTNLSFAFVRARQFYDLIKIPPDKQNRVVVQAYSSINDKSGKNLKSRMTEICFMEK